MLVFSNIRIFMNSSELKKEARLELSGHWLKIIEVLLVYVVIVTGLQLIINIIPNVVLKSILSICLLIISLPFSYGIFASILKISHNEDVSIFDFITLGLKNFKKVWGIFFRTLLKILVPFILNIFAVLLCIFNITLYIFNAEFSPIEYNPLLAIFSVVLLFCSSIYLIAKGLYYAITSYILYDNESLTSKEIVQKSQELMKGYRMKYILLNLSFIGWMLLIALVGEAVLLYTNNQAIYMSVIDVLTLLLTPYIYLTIYNFYGRISNKNSDNYSENNLNNNSSENLNNSAENNLNNNPEPTSDNDPINNLNDDTEKDNDSN